MAERKPDIRRARYLMQVEIREPNRPSPADKNQDEILEWMCECLGLGDEHNELANEIFKQLVLASRERTGVSTRQIKDKAQVTQGAVTYHMNVFIRSGVVVRQGRMYYLRAPTLDDTLSELEQYMVRRMERLRELARRMEGRF
jgi:hypothetical protein